MFSKKFNLNFLLMSPTVKTLEVWISRFLSPTPNVREWFSWNQRSLLLSSVVANIETVGLVFRIAKTIAKEKLDNRMRLAAEDYEQLLIYFVAELTCFTPRLTWQQSTRCWSRWQRPVEAECGGRWHSSRHCADDFDDCWGVEMRAALWNAMLETRNNPMLTSGFRTAGRRREGGGWWQRWCRGRRLCGGLWERKRTWWLRTVWIVTFDKHVFLSIFYIIKRNKKNIFQSDFTF